MTVHLSNLFIFTPSTNKWKSSHVTVDVLFVDSYFLLQQMYPVAIMFIVMFIIPAVLKFSDF